MDLSKDIRLSVSKLANSFSFVNNVIWSGLSTPITKEEISKAIKTINEFPDNAQSIPLKGTNLFSLEGNALREYHVNRIAYLVIFKANDAISIDTGVPSLGCFVKWPIDDGNHRLAAAIFREDEYIYASFSGEEKSILYFIEKYE